MTRSRLDVIDVDSGRLLETFDLETAFPTIVAARVGAVHVLSSSELLERGREAVGPAVPTFDWPDLDGARVTEANLMDKVTLINVWASWCAPCRREMPELIELWESLAGSGLDFYAVSEDVRPRDARDWLTETGLAPPVLLAGGRAGETFNYPGLPYTMLVDRHGRIVRRWIGYLGPGQIDAILVAARRELNLAHAHHGPAASSDEGGHGEH